MSLDNRGLRVLPHLLGSDQDRYEEDLRRSYDEGRAYVAPLLVVLVLQENCNVNCIYCPYVTDAIHAVKPFAKTSQWKTMLDQLARFGVRHVRFSGGEPTLRRDLVELVSYAKNLGLQTTMVSNGIRLTMPLGEALVDSGLGAMTLSIDSFNRKIYEYVRQSPYDKMREAVEVALRMRERSRRFWFGVNCVVTRHNIETIPDLVDEMSAREIPIQFMPVHSFAGDENAVHTPDIESITNLVARLIEQKREGRLINSSEQYLMGMVDFIRTGSLPDDFECSAGYLQVIIDPDLGLRPCCLLSPTDTLSETSIDEAWHGQAMTRARHDIKNHNCPRCWLMYVDSWK